MTSLLKVKKKKALKSLPKSYEIFAFKLLPFFFFAQNSNKKYVEILRGKNRLLSGKHNDTQIIIISISRAKNMKYLVPIIYFYVL